MAFNDRRLTRPDVVPPYVDGEGWAMDVWWSRP
jgi:microcin C transport system substrate-binding protein